jgi:hypothetical protein
MNFTQRTQRKSLNTQKAKIENLPVFASDFAAFA